MIIELHMLQNFAPSNLNRDDTGTPKSAEFGGHRRARISSQCQKRAIRSLFAERLGEFGLEENDLAERTKLVVDECATQLVDAGKPDDQARAVVSTLLGGVRLKLKDDKTEYLLFLGRREIAALSSLALQHWDELAAIVAPTDAPQGGKRNAKKDAAALVPDPIKKALIARFDAGKAIDVALFGRMVADLAEINSDAACQVAHALSTNRVNVEFDYFTAVDDIQKKQRKEDTGAGMIGTIEFNSACYYRYASVDLDQLTDNLGSDHEQAHKALRAFIQAMIEAVPTGKQNTFAAHNPPSLIAVVARDAGQWNLINAFARPIMPRSDQSIIDLSIAALDKHWGDLATMYGTRRLRGVWAVSSTGSELPHLAPTAEQQAGNVDDLIERVMATVQGAA